jgi:hypothetical protein
VFSDLIAVVALVLSAVTFGLAQRFAAASDRRSRIPVLVFVYDTGGHWLLRNIGNGPALNIALATKAAHEDHEWQNPTRMPALGRDRELQLVWLGDSDVAVLAATYEDFLGADTARRPRGYTVQMANDINEVVPRKELPRWGIDESVAHWLRVREWEAEHRTDGRKSKSRQAKPSLDLP